MPSQLSESVRTSEHVDQTETAAAQRSRDKTMRYVIAVVLLVGPAVVLRLFTAIYPFFETIRLSFYEYNPAFPPADFVGLENFTRMLSDPSVTNSISFTIIFIVVSTIIELIFGILIAMLLKKAFFGRGVVRAVSLIPWAIPMVVAAVGFQWMYNEQYGVINDLLYRLAGIKFAWLTRFWGARAAVILTNAWKSTPFLGLVFLASLQGVPDELYEAGRVDGTNRFTEFFHITLPLILPQVITLGIFMLVWQLASFDLILTMTGGGPGYATQVLAYTVYQKAFGGLNFGYASAISMVLFATVAIIGIAGLLAYRRVEVTY